MTNPIRIGLLGASKIARGALIGPARGDERFVLTAVAARDPARARAYAEEHGIAAVAADYAELVRREDVDVVYNALPPAGHEQWTIAALEAGKAVLCEKPFAKDAAQANAMTVAADRTGKLLIEAFHYRFHTVMRHAETIVGSGVLGDLIGAEAEFSVPIPRNPGELRWSAEQGGGGLMDLGCYPLHALRTLMRAEPVVKSAWAVFEEGVDSDLTADLSFAGAPARIACCMTRPKFVAWLRIDGTKGRLDIQNFLAPQMGCRFTTTIDGETTEHPTEGKSTYAAQLDHLHAVMTGGETPLTGGADAVGNMTALDAIYAAARR